MVTKCANLLRLAGEKNKPSLAGGVRCLMYTCVHCEMYTSVHCKLPSPERMQTTKIRRKLFLFVKLLRKVLNLVKYA
jgi:hypothetical protein